MSDYKALIETMRSKGQPPEHIGNRLADAVEALVAENETLRDISNINGNWNAKYARLCDERDALRAQLDSMTTEWGTKIVSEPGVDVGTEEYARRNVARWNESRYNRGDMAGVVVKRMVGPWVEVTDD